MQVPSGQTCPAHRGSLLREAGFAGETFMDAKVPAASLSSRMWFWADTAWFVASLFAAAARDVIEGEGHPLRCISRRRGRAGGLRGKRPQAPS